MVRNLRKYNTRVNARVFNVCDEVVNDGSASIRYSCENINSGKSGERMKCIYKIIFYCIIFGDINIKVT